MERESGTDGDDRYVEMACEEEMVIVAAYGECVIMENLSGITVESNCQDSN